MHGKPRESKLFQAIVEQVPDAIVFADCEGVIRIWNRAAEAVFGFAAQEVVGASLDVIIPERLRPAHWSAFDRAITAGRTHHTHVRTTRAMHKDGRKLYVELSFGLITDAAGKITGAVAVARDGSERFLADRALKERLAALESAGRSGSN